MPHEELNRDSRAFQVEFKDHSIVTYNIEYLGGMDYDVREDGGPSTWTHPFDDRRCSWSLSGAIRRKVSVVIGGETFEKTDLYLAYNANSQNVGSSFVLGNLRPENCNDCADRRASDFQNMRNNVNGMLQQVIASDLPLVEAKIRQSGNVVKVTAEIAKAAKK